MKKEIKLMESNADRFLWFVVNRNKDTVKQQILAVRFSSW